MGIKLDKISSFPDATNIDNTYMVTWNSVTGANQKISVPVLRQNTAQIQSDLSQTDTSQADYIKNKQVSGDLTGSLPAPNIAKKIAAVGNTTTAGFLIKTRISATTLYERVIIRIEGFTTTRPAFTLLQFDLSNGNQFVTTIATDFGRALGDITVFRYNGFVYVYIAAIQTYTALTVTGARTGSTSEIIDTITATTTGIPPEATSIRIATKINS